MDHRVFTRRSADAEGRDYPGKKGETDAICSAISGKTVKENSASRMSVDPVRINGSHSIDNGDREWSYQ